MSLHANSALYKCSYPLRMAYRVHVLISDP
jgi:hypothetical protein